MLRVRRVTIFMETNEKEVKAGKVEKRVIGERVVIERVEERAGNNY